MLVCNMCFNVFDSKMEDMLLNKRCILYNCGGKIVEIDEFILPAIINFNKIGLTTDLCCSGHYNDDRILEYPYISFIIYLTRDEHNNSFDYDNNRHIKILSKLPEPWQWDKKYYINKNEDYCPPYITTPASPDCGLKISTPIRFVNNCNNYKDILNAITVINDWSFELLEQHNKSSDIHDVAANLEETAKQE